MTFETECMLCTFMKYATLQKHCYAKSGSLMVQIWKVFLHPVDLRVLNSSDIATLILTYGFWGFTPGVTGQQGAPDPTSDIFRGPCMLILWFVFLIGFVRLITVCYLCHLLNKKCYGVKIAYCPNLCYICMYPIFMLVVDIFSAKFWRWKFGWRWLLFNVSLYRCHVAFVCHMDKLYVPSVISNIGIFLKGKATITT
jgi:hypothetical protein